MLGEQSPRPDTPWTVSDFALVILAGLAGGFAAAVWVIATQPPIEQSLIASALATSAGHLLGLAAVIRYRNGSWAMLGTDVRPLDGIYIPLGAGLQILLSLLFAPLVDRLDSDGVNQVVAEELTGIETVASRVIIVVIVALVAPAVEELVFRGLLQRSLAARMRPMAAVVITALVFSAFHWLGVDQTNVAAGLVTLLQLFLVGLVLGELTRRHARLGPAIFTHAGFNLLAALVLVFAPQLVRAAG